jgi:transcription elongation GreA/GreB family factor
LRHIQNGIMFTTIDKKRVFQAAHDRLSIYLKDLRERIEDLRSVTIGDDNAESASQTESTHGSDVEVMNSLSEQLEHVQQDMERLDLLDVNAPMDTVQFGSVVITDQRNFLIATSVEEFEVDGLRFLGVTPRAPLIQALLGHRVGETIAFNSINYTIREIH